MKVEFAFRNIESSDLLMQYADERLGKIERYELDPMDVHITVSMLRHECQIEMHVQEGRRKYKATAVSDDFYRSVEMAVNKLYRQLSKEKRRIHDLKHRRPEQTHEGKLARLSPSLGITKKAV